MSLLILRTVVIYVVMTVCVRMLGKRQVGELQSSELVITLLLSELATIPIQDPGAPLLSGILPMAMLVVCELAVSAGMMKSRRFRQLLCGRPVVVIRDGALQPLALRRLRMTVEDLTERLRMDGVFDLRQVDFAAVEPSGQLSVLKKAEFEPPDAAAWGMTPQTAFSAVVMCEGEFCPHSAGLVKCSRGRVRDILRREKCTEKNVFLLTVDRTGSYLLLRRDQVLQCKKGKGAGHE